MENAQNIERLKDGEDMNDIELRELDAWIAEHLFSYEWRRSEATGRRGLFPPDYHPEWFKERADMTEGLCYDHPSHVPPYSSSISSAMEMEEKILEMGLQREYAKSLINVVADECLHTPELNYNFDLIHATPLQRCLAVKVVIEKKGFPG